MFRRVVLVLLVCIFSSPTISQAQGTKLGLIIANLFGPDGLFVESEAPLPGGGTHSAHFNSSFQSDFTQFNIALASELSALPLPSPASGLTYEFDAASGAFTRTTQGFGPILSERAETIGKGRFSFGFNYQRFSFDSIEGLSLGEIPAVFTHDGAAPGGKADVVTTVNSIDVTLNQFTAFFTYGLADSVDLSLGIPLVNTEMTVSSVTTVQRLGTSSNRAVHFFGDGFGDTQTFSGSGSASGIGDIVARLKGTVAKSGATGLALGLDVRFPTGDEEDLLGSGAWGLKPFAALSFSSQKAVSPHINLGYQWNGDSTLASDFQFGASGAEFGEKADLPDSFIWIFGVDFGLGQSVTVIFDVIGTTIIDSPRLVEETFTGLDPAGTTFSDIGFVDETFSLVSGALGFKVNLGGDFLIDFNLLFKLNDAGLRDDVTPLIGMEYSF